MLTLRAMENAQKKMLAHKKALNQKVVIWENGEVVIKDPVDIKPSS